MHTCSGSAGTSSFTANGTRASSALTICARSSAISPFEDALRRQRRNQALSAVLFLYREVLKQNLPWIEGVQRAKQPRHLPVVPTRHEVRPVLAQLEGTVWMMASLTYGGGFRLLECLRLRVKDIDFERGELRIRDSKGQKDRVTMLPRLLHLGRVSSVGTMPARRCS